MDRKLTQVELESALKDIQPVLTPEEAAKMLRLKVSTLYRHVSEGRYSGAVRAEQKARGCGRARQIRKKGRHR